MKLEERIERFCKVINCHCPNCGQLQKDNPIIIDLRITTLEQFTHFITQELNYFKKCEESVIEILSHESQEWFATRRALIKTLMKMEIKAKNKTP